MISFMVGYLAVVMIVASLICKKSIKSIAREMIAPMITAFSTMSSAATLPFSLKAASNNTGDEKVANLVMPITMNIHMVGDAICIPIMAMIILLGFNVPIPTLEQYAVFMAAFLMAKFSGAAVPGGSILVMIPVLEKTLGFNQEMVALITTLYMICDPIVTSGNVVGNNVFVMYFSKIAAFLQPKKPSALPSQVITAAANQP
jgi:Na+/H+-dicarboxylate symporter